MTVVLDDHLLRNWLARRDNERRALIAGLMALPADVPIVPMQRLARRMGELVADHHGLSTLGAEAVAATVDLGGRLLVSLRDDGPDIRHCCLTFGVRYHALAPPRDRRRATKSRTL